MSIQRWDIYATGDGRTTKHVQTADGVYVTYADHVEALDNAVSDARARAYTLMGAAIQNGINAERKRIRFAIAALVDGDVIDLSLPEYRTVLEAIEEEEKS